jgi:TonB-linked SusC/RagA family outer membrane protein
MKKLLQSMFLLLFIAIQAIAQERTVTGTVTDKVDGLPLPGVGVRVKGTNLGTSTGSNGQFSVTVPSGSNTLTFSFIGYATQDVVIPAGNVMKVILSSSTETLNEVVITAGGVSIQRREQGNQATTIKAEDLTQAKAFNVASALTGKVAGLQVNAVSSGVNPNIRIVLRGNRSLLGNNQALVVVDNVIVPTNVLGNLNPEDIEDIQVLNGAGAASLYGSDASNGALIITTKKGKRGSSKINFSHTSSLEEVSFLPKLQTTFGSGTGPDDIPTYTPYENQQYGPRFDGSNRVIGKPLADGSIQTVPYSPSSEGKNAFWETGLSNQSDISLSSGDENGTFYTSAQYFDQASTVPGDKYNRFTIRVNGERFIKKNFTFNFNANYVQNRYDISTATGSAFENVLMTPAQVPLTRYSDWENDPFASPNGYFNEYYPNPYFTLGNNRQKVRNDYLVGQAGVKWFPVKELSLLFRVSISTQNASSKNWTNQFIYSPYRLALTSNFNNILGAVGDDSSYSTQLNPEFQAQYIKKITKDLSLNTILGASIRDNNSKAMSASINGLVQPDLFNLSNRLQNANVSESNSRNRQIGVYLDARLGFKDYLYLHVTGRNDWRSVLSKENRSFFYPSADISFVASDAISFLKDSKVIESLKIRGGVSKVGLVNIGAYSLLPTFGQGFGYPFNGVAGYSLSDRIVSPNINPEITVSYEGGLDFELFKSRIFGSITAYKSNTTDQTVPVGIAGSTGFTSFLTNTGEVQNTGIETSLRVIPIQTSTGWELSVGANYTNNNNKVLSISNDQTQIQLGSSGSLGVYAVENQPFPLLKGTIYNRDPQGRIIVDAITGFPSVSTAIFDLGQTEPKHRLGLDATLKYKSVRLATVFEYRAGNNMYNAASTGYDFSGAGIRSTYFNRERFVVPNSSYLDGSGNYVSNTNITTRTGGVDFWTNGPSNTAVNENYVYSAAFWKLRELSLSYELPPSLLKNMKFVKGANISVQGRNLFLWTPSTNIYTDPEYSALGSTSNAIGITSLGQTPPARFYGATLSVTF